MIVNTHGAGRPMALFCHEIHRLESLTVLLVGVDLLLPGGSLNVAKLGEDGIWRVYEGWSTGLILRDDALGRFYADPNAPLKFAGTVITAWYAVLPRLTKAQYEGAFCLQEGLVQGSTLTEA